MLTFRQFLRKYNPTREIFSGIFPKEQISPYAFGKSFMSLPRAFAISEISVVWLIKNEKNPKDKIDPVSLVSPKNKNFLKRLNNL